MRAAMKKLLALLTMIVVVGYIATLPMEGVVVILVRYGVQLMWTV